MKNRKADPRGVPEAVDTREVLTLKTYGKRVFSGTLDYPAARQIAKTIERVLKNDASRVME